MTFPAPSLSPAHQKARNGIEPHWFNISSEGEIGHRWADGEDTWGMGPDGKAGTDWHETVDPRENVLIRLHEHMRGVGSDLWRVYGNIDYEKTPNAISLTLVTEFVLDVRQKLLLEALCRVAYPGTDTKVNVLHPAHDEVDKEQIEVVFDIMGMSYAEVCAMQLAFLNHEVVQGFDGAFVSVM